ncbi:Metallo-peptidase family M12B Reprolysin-like-domain-containing protein [Mucor mucedo]|uniref:Metallo-peptidase family M12B Reprolysin-like-domain-containing protein n=1 Tax=Mucor mucedo TaxID=29922 RepID=UPI00222078C8|nr:Metallo-peptidase family M12B Reprolysin-like-domain-containing protein [Mucor mucedo]KAI7895890.1 Metallo-peptidase family M12B Reprolysin-like-domain-containing protein [Mucor mucedo]
MCIGHSVNSKQLLWVEPVSTVKLDIAARSDQFFAKREISENSHYQPNVRSLAHDDSLRLTVNAFNKTMYLHLTPNQDLFHPNAVFHQDGKSTPIKASDYRVYRGYVIDDIYSQHWWISGLGEDMENQPGVLGWARIIVRNDIRHNLDHPMFEGTFSIYGDTHHVKLTENYQRTKRSDDAELQSTDGVHMVVYRDSNTVEKSNGGGSCGFDQLQHSPFDKKTFHNPLEIVDHQKRTNFGTIHTGNTLSKRVEQGCPATKKILYMGAAADCTYVKHYQSTDNARMQIINNWNSVSSVYSSSFNVALGLINITIMDSACPTTPSTATAWNQQCSTAYSITSRLSDFSKWRGSIGDDGAGLWHLMTNCATGAEVGIAWMSTVCTTGVKNSNTDGYTSGTGVSSIIRDEWKVVAHEIGHNFGAMHDCNSQTCPCSGASCQCCPLSDTTCDAGGRYFMNPVSNASSDAFSPCSIKSICTAMPQHLSCLEDPGSRNVTTLKMCGNGIKEDGEDCDTGGQDSACCNPTTCKFKTGAVCDDFNDLCCTGCQLRPANYTCRAASTECDLAEVCSGTSGDCPVDKYKDDLTSCSNGNKCASGQCTSRDAQCVARGVSMNMKKACSSQSGCEVTCQDPRSSMSCTVFPGYFVDGTPCGVGSVCKSGQCNSDNAGNVILDWINNHKQIVIPVAIVVGLFFLFCLFRCCCYGGRSGYNNMSKTTYIIPAQQQGYQGQYNGQVPYYPPPPGPGHQQPYYSPPPNNGWVDPAQYNGANYGPRQPLPVYTQNDPHTATQESYELNNANNWNRGGAGHTTPVPSSPSPGYQAPASPIPGHGQTPAYGQMPSPSPVNAYPPPPPHGTSNNRPYHEGVI